MGAIAETRGNVFADIARRNTVASRAHPTEINVGKRRVAYIAGHTLLRGVQWRGNRACWNRVLIAVVQILRRNASTWHNVHDMDRTKHGYILNCNLMSTAKSAIEEQSVGALRAIFEPHGR